jgi:hypothetical protein
MKVDQKPVIGTAGSRPKCFGGCDEGGGGMTKTGKGETSESEREARRFGWLVGSNVEERDSDRE